MRRAATPWFKTLSDDASVAVKPFSAVMVLVTCVDAASMTLLDTGFHVDAREVRRVAGERVPNGCVRREDDVVLVLEAVRALRLQYADDRVVRVPELDRPCRSGSRCRTDLKRRSGR